MSISNGGRLKVSKLLAQRKNMIGFIIFALILLIVTSLLKLSSQVTITIIILTIFGLVFMELKNKKSS